MKKNITVKMLNKKFHFANARSTVFLALYCSCFFIFLYSHISYGLPAVFMKTTVSPNTPLEQSEIRYTVKIFYNTSIENASLSAPSAPNTTVTALGHDNNTQTTLDNTPYRVTERYFMLFPNKSGPLTITPPTVEGNIVTVKRIQQSDHWFVSKQLHPITITTLPSTLTVKPKPMTWQGWWLPAYQVTLTDHWSDDIKEATEGEPLMRTISVKAVGVLAEQLPQLVSTAPKGWRIYREKPVLHNEGQANHMVGQRIEKIAYVPQNHGQLTLPPVAVTWWDLSAHATREAILPQRTIFVAATVNNEKNTVAPLPPSSNTIKPIATTAMKKSHQPHYYQVIAFVFLLFILLSLCYLSFLFIKKYVTDQLPRKNPYHYATPKRLKKILAQLQLRKACKKNQATQVQFYLLKAINLKKEEHFNTLGQLKTLWPDKAWQKAITDLQRACYNNYNWQGNHLWHAFKNRPKAKKQSIMLLAPLFPKIEKKK